jgi:hypothetical protein
MATEIRSMVGSGTQQTRQDNFQKHHNPAQAVHVVNWEDVNAVQEVKTAGFDVVAAATVLPSGTAALAGRRVIAIYNNDTTNPVYVGASDVSETNGYPVAAGTEKAFALAGNLGIYCVAGAGNSVNVRIMEIA